MDTSIKSKTFVNVRKVAAVLKDESDEDKIWKIWTKLRLLRMRQWTVVTGHRPERVVTFLAPRLQTEQCSELSES